MPGHPLRKYARHVQNSIVEAGLPKPGYQWCLAMVQRRYDQAKAETTSIPERKELLVRAILPVARLQQDLEGKYVMPPGGILKDDSPKAPR